MKCIFKDKVKDSPCINCGYTLKRDYKVTPYRTCSTSTDWVESIYIALKRKLGLKPECRCKARKAKIKRGIQWLVRPIRTLGRLLRG